MTRILLIGQAPSRRTDGSAAFTGNSGRRLAALAGLSHAEFFDRFDALNLIERYPGRLASGRGDAFDRQAAHRAAELLKPTLPPRVILIGHAVAHAFDWADLGLCLWSRKEGRRIALVPHPSGLNRWWNDPTHVAQARAFLSHAAGSRSDPGSSRRRREP